MGPEEPRRHSGTPSVYSVGGFRFPDGDAAAARVLGVGKALRAAGARVTFGGWEKEGRPQDLQPDGSFRFEGFPYVSQGDIRYAQLPIARRLACIIFAGQNTLRWLARQPIQPGDVVVAYHGGAYFLSRLKRWCGAVNVRLVLDCTEWYSPRQLPGGRASPAWWNSEITMRAINPTIGRLIVISSYLEAYYTSRGCDVLRVPPLIDIEGARWAANPVGPPPSPLRLAYAGTPGRKDLLMNVLLGLSALRAENQAVILSLIGPTRESVIQAFPGSARLLTQLGERVVFQGRVPQSDVPRRLRESHFTVLVRPDDERYARAGFPTKVVESLGAGVPVITNPTSDLSRYIQDGSEGIFLDNGSPEALIAGIRRLKALGPSVWRDMRRAARLKAASAFDYRTYIAPLRAFVLGISGDASYPA